MKNTPDYDSYMKFMAVALCMAIFAFVIPTVHQFVENLFIYDLGNNELNEPLEALIILVSYWFTIPIYNIFYEELIK